MTKEEAETREQLKEASRVHTEWQTLSTQAKAIPEVLTTPKSICKSTFWLVTSYFL